MPDFIRSCLTGSAATILLFLCLWTVLPPINFFWLKFAVVAPEISPLLALVSAIALLLVLLQCFWQNQPQPFLLIAVLTVSLVLSSWPLVQLPNAMTQAEKSMATAFKLPASAGPSAMFSWSRFFRGVPTAEVRHQAKIPFAQPEGTQLFLDLYQPPTPGRYPAIVTLYGGGWSRGDSSENEAFAKYFAARGYVVVAIEYRLTPHYRFPAQAQDVKTALDFIRRHAVDYEIECDEQAVIDKADLDLGAPPSCRMSLVGWSAGAQLAMVEGFQSAEDVRSIVDYYGPVNLASGYANPPVPDPLDVRQVLEAFLGGTPAEQPEAYATASPITYVQMAQPNTLPPTLLIYGGRDHIVEAKYGQYLHSQIVDTGNTSVWVHIPWAEHAFDKIFNGVSNQLALHFIERFLAETL